MHAFCVGFLLRGAIAASPDDLSNFQGNFGCDEGAVIARVVAGASPRGQLEAVRDAVQRAARVRATGLGHSWWRKNFCAGGRGGVNVMMRGRSEDGLRPPRAVVPSPSTSPSTPLSLNGGGDVVVDVPSQTVRAPAGMTTREVLDLLARATTSSVDGATGHTLPTFPWFIDQTIGGAVATGSHGSSLSHGSLSSRHVLLAMTAVLANGTVVELSPEKTPGMWRAFAVSAGRLGIIVDVTLRIVPNEVTRRDVAVISTSEMLADIAEVQEVARVAASNSSFSFTETAARLNERQYLWFMTRAPDAPNGAWRADFSPSDRMNVSTAREWTRVEEKRFRDSNADPRYTLQQLFASVTTANWDKDDTDENNSGHRYVGISNVAKDGSRAGDGGAVMYDRNPPAWLRERRGIISPETGVMSSGFQSAIMGLDPREQAEVTATLLLEQFHPQISPRRLALVHQTAPMAKGAPDLMPYDQYEVAIPLTSAGDCMTLVAARLYDGPEGDAAWRAMRAPALIRFVAAEPENLLSPSWDGPKMYVNIEDYIKYSKIDRRSSRFDTVMEVLQGDGCRGRLHWGKAGRRGRFDVGEDPKAYGSNWCHFACAALAVDPTGKFQGEWDGWSTWDEGALERCCAPGDAKFMFDSSRGCGSCTLAMTDTT